MSGDASDARRGDLLVNLLVEQASLKGNTIGVVGFESDRDAIDGALLPALTAAGLNPAEVFYNTVAGGDQQANDALMDVWSERVRSDGIDQIIFAANAASLVGDLVKRGYEGEISADNAGLSLAGEEIDAGSPLDGAITLLPAPDGWNSPRVQECAAVFEAAHPDLAPIPDPSTSAVDSGLANRGIGIQWACTYFDLFLVTMAAADAPTNEALLEAITTRLSSFSFGPNKFASFGPDKFDANDGFAEAVWDSSIPPDGIYRATSEVIGLG